MPICLCLACGLSRSLSTGGLYVSNRGDLTERLVRIPLILVGGRRSQRELAIEFAVDGVTIRRNLTELMRHYNIVDEKDGREVFYQFGDGYKFTPPSFTPMELATLLLAQQSITATGVSDFGTPFAGYGRVLLDKVRAALPPGLREYLDALANIFGTAMVPAKDYTPHAETIDRLTKAAVARRRVRMDYESLTSGESKVRNFDPYSVYLDPDGATLKTIGYDHHHREIRSFSIDRIIRLEETTEVFVRPPDYTLQGYLTKYCFNGIHGDPITIRLKAYGVTARIFAERRFHPSQREIERVGKRDNDEESITIEMQVASGRGLERFILSWAPEIEVLSPLELRERVTALYRQAINRHLLNTDLI
jgi:predicted DNA-binding transcriptional regulator YafY